MSYLDQLLENGAGVGGGDPVTAWWQNQRQSLQDSYAANMQRPVMQRAIQAGSWGPLSQPPMQSEPLWLARYQAQQQREDEDRALLLQKILLGAETERYKADKMGDWRTGLLDVQRQGLEGKDERAQEATRRAILTTMMRGRGAGGGGAKIGDMLQMSMYNDLRKRMGGDKADPGAVFGQYRQITGGGQQGMGMDEILALIQALRGVGPGGF